MKNACNNNKYIHLPVVLSDTSATYSLKASHILCSYTLVVDHEPKQPTHQTVTRPAHSNHFHILLHMEPWCQHIYKIRRLVL